MSGSKGFEEVMRLKSRQLGRDVAHRAVVIWCAGRKYGCGRRRSGCKECASGDSERLTRSE